MNDPQVGKRVQLHPATDAWMRGDRYGVIVHMSCTPQDRVHVRMDKTRGVQCGPGERFRKVRP